MAGILADELALDDIGKDDVFVTTPADKLRVVFADVQRVHVVVVDVFVVFYHKISRRVVETDAAIFRASHAVIPLVVEFHSIDWTRVYFDQLNEFRRQFVHLAAAH